MKNNRNKEITIYDNQETTNFINKNKPLKLHDLDLELPQEEPTKIVSIRIPTQLYYEIRAFCTNIDMPYQAYIKYLLYDGLKRKNAMLKKMHNESK
ncbi:MAG: hypothetical protein WC860_05685 [Candidatus Margulisiibacteriota bacterium]|jgi:predicted DNA binding CopG/RHH family protein